MVYKNLLNRLFFAFGTFIYVFIFYEIFKFFKKAYFQLILFYLTLSYLCFTLFFFNYYDSLIFNIFVLTIIFFDSFSYFFGKILGKKYIFKYLSPKKTFEGYFGGILLTNVILIGVLYFILTEINIIKLTILINSTIFISIFGDLIESFFKRQNNIKDSSNYLPGHGGFFDRFDSFIASIIMLIFFQFIINS